ncbi:hypothetical protein KM043_011373 [Ampulex compressa]|nr:hypothetical protein KM043_011373 [Ampulex compressa]
MVSVIPIAALRRDSTITRPIIQALPAKLWLCHLTHKLLSPELELWQIRLPIILFLKGGMMSWFWNKIRLAVEHHILALERLVFLSRLRIGT